MHETRLLEDAVEMLLNLSRDLPELGSLKRAQLCRVGRRHIWKREDGSRRKGDAVEAQLDAETRWRQQRVLAVRWCQRVDGCSSIEEPAHGKGKPITVVVGCSARLPLQHACSPSY